MAIKTGRQSKKGSKSDEARQVAAPLFLHSARQLVTVADAEARRARAGNSRERFLDAIGGKSDGPRRGKGLREVGVIEDGALLIAGGKIVAVGTTKELMRDSWLKKNRAEAVELDCTGKVVTPGFVDSHTHPVFGGPRLVDFEKRIAGASYEEIAKAGGGIRSSIDGVREASVKQLAQRTLAAFEEMGAHGTTTVEAKSGYGLSFEAEMKSLKAIREAASCWAGTVVPTLLAAHVVPPEFKKNRREYVRLICEEMIPETAKKKLAKYVDVFCERGAFTLEETEKIFKAAYANELEVRAHVSQWTRTDLWGLVEGYQAASLDHMDYVNDEDLRTLAENQTVATLVPGANYFLATKAYPPARKMIDAGVPVALATDYNPGSSPTVSMPMVMSIACTQMKMTPEEALVAATINGAWALGLAESKGSLEPGKDADLAIFAAEDYREIAYWFGWNRCAAVLTGGELVLR